MIILALPVAAIGGMIALRRKVPAGALIGAVIAVAALNMILGSEVVFPMQIKLISQAMTGAYIGAKIQKKDLVALRSVLLPALILSMTMLFFNVAISWMLYKSTILSLETALFATAPAGITDMTLASMDFANADPPKVAVLQMVRLLSVLSIMPWIVKWVNRRQSPKSPEIQTEDAQTSARCYTWQNIASTALIGFTTGGIGFFSGIPAGAISFAMAGCAVYNIKTQNACIPIKLRQYIQILAGALIGGLVTRTQIIQLAGMLPVVVIVIIGFLILNLTTAVLLHKLGKMDPTTSLLASSAGGLTDMAIIAEELGAESTKVATMQLIRVVSVIALYPTIISRLLNTL